MAEKYLAKFKVHVNVGLGYDVRKKGMQLLNEHFTGKSTVNARKTVSMEHRVSHENIHRYAIVTLEVGLKEDGNFDVLRIVEP